MTHSVKTCFEKLVNKQPQRGILWKYYSDFIHFDFAFYSLKHGIRQIDPEKKRVFMIEEPETEVETYKRKMLEKRFELTLKECHAVMKIGWECEK